MKIAFVNDTSQHLGIQSLASVLKDNGHQVKIFTDPHLFEDLYIYFKPLSRLFDCKKQIVSDLKAYKPDLIGFSVVTFFYQWACTLARMIKEEIDVPIIFGGIHPTSVPERVIRNDFVDMVCVGEGEYPMLELADSMQKGRIDTSIRNIWFKKDGQVIANDVRPLIEDLDSLPMPDKEIYYLSSPYFTRGYNIMTSRGCPFACSYCYNSYFHQLYKGRGRLLRQRSVQKVIDELKQARDCCDLKWISFIDDCFGYDIHWLRDFSFEYKKNISVDFFCIMHPNHVSDESIRYLKYAGCRSISLGIQTWDKNIRENLFNRKSSEDIMENAIRTIKKEKIDVVVDNLFGFPDYDDEKYIQSLMHYTRTKPTRNYFYKLKYYPNTVIAQESLKKGLLSHSRYEEILEGKNLDGLRIESGHKKRTNGDIKSIKMQVLFVIMDLIPRQITGYIIRKRLYHYLPILLNPAVLTVLRTIISSDFESRLFRSEVLWRYGYFLKQKILNNKKNENCLYQ